MMKYKKRPGILVEKICGQNILIPTRSAYPYCKNILPLKLVWLATWELIGEEDGDEKIMRFHQILTKKTDEEIRTRVTKFCKDLVKMGFLIELPEEESEGGA